MKSFRLKYAVIYSRIDTKELIPDERSFIALDLRDSQTFDGWQRIADEALEVAVETGEVADGAEDLLLALGPESLR
jgi:hypothetical protein